MKMPLNVLNKAASTAAQRGIRATKRVQEQLTVKLRGHEAADSASVERLKLLPAHCVKQHHNSGHCGQRHRARPVAPLL